MKNLFESIPCGVFIIDDKRRVQAINNVLEQAFHTSSLDVIDHMTGDALRCVRTYEEPKGCGFTEECMACGIRNTALEALEGNKIHRNKANV
ncbi:MAG: hypothetical protein JSW04_09840, partial [Desulfobacterales bacterium]